MIISEQQIMMLIDIAQEYAIHLSAPRDCRDHVYAMEIAELIRKIKDQQSEELKEVK